jgi:chorismate mutase
MELSLTPIEEWGFPLKDIFLSAGPCSAESEEQVLAIARDLSGSGISFMRAGLWKPRTHPGGFEGVGIEGLKWLTRAREKYNIRVGIEVASPEHVEACLEHKIDIVWIGARTTPNPFAVQALADALEGSDMPVLIKNPISPDIELWIGAIERMHGAGLRKIGVIHRGFSSSRKSMYRFAPNWKIPIELKRRLPQLPIICDPSHICGQAGLIFSIAQEAMDLLYDGLMVEVHTNPPEALSDAKQQLTPRQFKELLDRLTFKREVSESQEFRIRLGELRQEVDGIDKNVLELLGKRMDIVREMWALKLENDVSALQPHRWEEIVQSRIAAGGNLELSENFIFQLFQAIHEEAIRQQAGDAG